MKFVPMFNDPCMLLTLIVLKFVHTNILWALPEINRRQTVLSLAIRKCILTDKTFFLKKKKKVVLLLLLKRKLSIL
jgi:hypothetical protein